MTFFAIGNPKEKKEKKQFSLIDHGGLLFRVICSILGCDFKSI
jgi:hypothetical protein